MLYNGENDLLSIAKSLVVNLYVYSTSCWVIQGQVNKTLIYERLYICIRQRLVFSMTRTMWCGGLVVGRRTCDLRVAGSRPGRDVAAQQP